MSEEECGDSPMEELLSRQRKEKKDLQAKFLAMKKTAKSGNKKQQKESGEEMIKMEKEMEERHKREVEEIKEKSGAAAPQEVKSGEKGEEKEEGGAFYKEKTTKGKNQKRMERKAEERKKQAAAASVDEEAAKTSMRTMEMKAVVETLLPRGLSLVDIPPDGDCLFHAVAHQLTIGGKECLGADLRRRAAAFIRSHKDDFLPFLSTEDGDILDEFQFEEYCVKVEKEACSGGQWGGEPELRALAETLQRKIEV
ncbi:hypothetical protein PFISCL1PPCAC_23613, partial [Pristionchus fissidentatus]